MLADLKIVEDKLFLPEALEEFHQVGIPPCRNTPSTNWSNNWTKHPKKIQDSSSEDTCQNYPLLITTAISCLHASLNKIVNVSLFREEEGVHQIRKLVAQWRIFCSITTETLRRARPHLKLSNHGSRSPQNDRLLIWTQIGQTLQRTIWNRLRKIRMSFQSTNIERVGGRVRIFWGRGWTIGRHWYSGTNEILGNRGQYRYYRR